MHRSVNKFVFVQYCDSLQVLSNTKLIGDYDEDRCYKNRHMCLNINRIVWGWWKRRVVDVKMNCQNIFYLRLRVFSLETSSVLEGTTGQSTLLKIWRVWRWTGANVRKRNSFGHVTPLNQPLGNLWQPTHRPWGCNTAAMQSMRKTARKRPSLKMP